MENLLSSHKEIVVAGVLASQVVALWLQAWLSARAAARHRRETGLDAVILAARASPPGRRRCPVFMASPRPAEAALQPLI
jgi:hypothetical protein